MNDTIERSQAHATFVLERTYRCPCRRSGSTSSAPISSPAADGRQSRFQRKAEFHDDRDSSDVGLR